MSDEPQVDRPIDPDRMAVRKIGKYTVIQEIARGGAGVVYEAIDPDMSRKVALKILKSDAVDHVERLKREGTLAGRLSHPGIIAIHEIGEAHDPRLGDMVHYIAMDLVVGITLEEALPQLSIPDRLEMVRRIADAIGFAHAAGVVHRDVKPANVLLDEEARPIVTDFGLARSERDNLALTETGDMLGTAHYMAPEQVLGMRDIDARTDVWALGVILYRALTERLPFPGKTAAEVYDKIIRFQPVSPRRLSRDVPTELETIALVALEKAPKRRYPDARALAADLARFQAGEPLVARPPSWPVRQLRRLTRRPGVLVAALLAGTVWLAAALSTLAATQREAASRSLTAALVAQTGERVRGSLSAANALKALRRQLARDPVFRDRAGHRQPAAGDDPLARELMAQLGDWPGISWVSWSTTEGDFVGAYRLPGVVGTYYNKSYVSPELAAFDFRLEGGEVQRLTESPWGAKPGYDPRTRPFYRRAVATGDIAWTKPYIFYGSYPGISCAAPVYADGELLGVATIDYEIWELSEALRGVCEEQDAPQAVVALTTPTGAIVAHSNEWIVSEPAKLTKRPPDLGYEVLRRYDELDDPLLDALSAALGGPRLGAPAELLLDAADGKGSYRTLLRPLFAVEGLPLAVVVAVPERAAERPSTRLLRRFANALWLVAVGLSVMGLFLLHRHFSSPWRSEVLVGTSTLGSRLGTSRSVKVSSVRDDHRDGDQGSGADAPKGG